MGPDREALARELALLAETHRTFDPVLASVVAAIFLEDAAGVVLSDSQIEHGFGDPSALDRVMSRGERGS